MLDLAIKGGKLVTECETLFADIGVENGKITLLVAPGALPSAQKELNADGMLVLPGAVDIHFHARAPGYSQRGTFATETRAAAAGGVTTILEMPISQPCCATREVFDRRRELGCNQAYTNFGLYGAPGLLDRGEILAMAEAGACGFKVFTHSVPPARESEFLGLCLPHEQDIYVALEMIKETGLNTVFHAENEGMLSLFESRLKSAGRSDPMAFAESRPPIVEALSIAQIAVLCESVGTRVHIAHVSGAWPLRMVREAQGRNLPLTAETCPHYLCFNIEDFVTHGSFAKIKPPLRTHEDQRALWEGLRDGTLAVLTTDHSPFTYGEKQQGINDIWSAPTGVVGIEALVTIVMTEALKGTISLNRAVALISSQPARLFDLYPVKGAIQPGSDADLVIFDPEANGRIDTTRWFTQAKKTDRLYHNRPYRGLVRSTIVNGHIVYERGQIVAEPGSGRFVRPRLQNR